jgi:hypothetical protein
MTILSLAEVARERLNQGSDAANDLAWCIRPIYGADEATRPMHIGTALLLDLAEGPHILTAAHVIDWADQTTLYLGIHTTVEVPRTFLTTAAPGGDRLADVVDVAIAPFPTEHLGSLDGAGFLPETQIDNWQGPSVGRSFTCIGFPNSQNRTPPRSRPNIMRPKTRTYTGTGADVSRLPGRANEHAHILVNFDFKHSRLMDGRRTASGKPDGMSGGAVFDLGNLGDPAALTHPIEPKLAGVFIEAHRPAGVIMATRIAPIVHWFRRTGALASLNTPP